MEMMISKFHKQNIYYKVLFVVLLFLTSRSHVLAIISNDTNETEQNQNITVGMVTAKWDSTNTTIKAPANFNSSRSIITSSVGSLGIVFNLFGCIFILTQTFLKWRMCCQKVVALPMSYRLPFYTALTDLFILSVQITSLLDITIHKKLPANPGCELLAIAQDFSYSYNNFLYMIIAISTYLEVGRRIPVNFGRYDYKLFLIINGLTVSCVSPKIIGRTYGQQYGWCSANGTFINAILSFFSMGIPILVTTFSCIAICILLGKRNDDRFREAVLTQNCMINSDDEIIIRKVTSYLIVFLLQWIPMVVHIICVVLNAVGTWNLVLLVLGLSCGGIGNALNFIRNERFNKEVVITDSALSPDTNNQLYYNAPAIIHQDTTGLPANLR